MNYHDSLIEEIIRNKEKLECIIGVYDSQIQKNLSLGSFGDIDLLVRGIDYQTQKEVLVVIEVKSHKGLVSHYFRFQLLKYISKFPNAKQYVAYGNSSDVDFNKIEFIDSLAK